MKLMLASDADEAYWENFISECPAALFSHSFKFKHIFESVFGLKTLYYYIIDQNNIKALCPLVSVKSFMHLNKEFLICLPMVTAAGIASVDKACHAFLLESLKSLADKRKCFIQIRSNSENSIPSLPSFEGYASFCVNLKNNYFGSLSSRNRNKIKKAGKSNIHVIFGKEELIDAFYIIHTRRFKQFGSPVFPKQYFKQLLETFPESYIAMACHKDTPVSAMLNIGFKNTMNYFMGCSDNRYYKIYPNNLLYFEVMEAARKKGYTRFDFGRSPIGSGGYRFKAQWDASINRLYYQYIGKSCEKIVGQSIQSISGSKSFQIFKLIWSNCLPDFMIHKISPYLIKRLPLA